MQIHASCVARAGAAVLLTGQPGCGKSDLALRLLELGFTLVADDRVDVRDQIASAPEPLAGLLEIRGVGIVRLDYAAAAPLRLVARLGPGRADRLPAPATDAALGLPEIQVDPWEASAAHKVAMALECARGRVVQLAGVFAP
jgi:HPr kinase/phosphorylase